MKISKTEVTYIDHMVRIVSVVNAAELVLQSRLEEYVLRPERKD